MKDTFSDYLKEKGYTSTTIRSYLLNAERFLLWLNSEQLEVEQLDYKQVLRYVKYLREKGLSSRTISCYIGALKLYYNCLITENKASHNPFLRLELRPAKRQRIKPTFDLELLDYLFEGYPKESLTDRRDCVILGLMVYQGLSSTDVRLLKTSDFDWLKGRLQVPQGKKTAARSLDLYPFQLIALRQYLDQDREQIHQIAEQTEQLFFGSGGRLNLDNVLARITKKLKQLYPEFTTLQVIRNTRITYWIQTEGLRKAQYKAGHRYISSTEAYKPIKDDSLFTMVSQFHPIR